jgi:aspartate/methionine/tyrosine aminotransferase
MKEMKFWLIRYPTYTSDELSSRAVPVYYDLKESTDWEPDFEALEN